MNFILLLLEILLLTNLSFSSSYIEVCEPFPVHHNFYNCEEFLGRRSSEGITTNLCLNQGTWKCSDFICYRDDGVDMDGYCLYGMVRQDNCCTFKNIHYVDVWISPNNATYNMTEIPDRRSIEADYYSPDWWLEIYNLDIKGVGPDIYIESGYLFQNVYPNVTKESELLFISVIMRYNGSCNMWVEVYINAVLVANSTHDDGLDMWSGTSMYPMVEIVNNLVDDDQVFFISAHEIIPTLAQIEYLYSLGPNRTTDVEICQDTEHALCHGSCITGMASDTYVTLTIVFGVIFGGLFCLLSGIILWWFMRKKTNKEEEEGFIELTSF